MPTAEEMIETRNAVKTWYRYFLQEGGHPDHSIALIMERTPYEIMLEEYKKNHPYVWTGPYSSF
jgi:hypothetical protein